MNSEIALNELIAITPGVCGGKPRIANRRITVEAIAIWHERLGLTADQIAAEYGLTLAEVYAALAYYFAHREAVEQAMREGQTLAETMRQATPSLVKQRLHGE